MLSGTIFYKKSMKMFKSLKRMFNKPTKKTNLTIKDQQEHPKARDLTADEYKEVGNHHFEAQRYEAAIGCYTTAIVSLISRKSITRNIS